MELGFHFLVAPATPPAYPPRGPRGLWMTPRWVTPKVDDPPVRPASLLRNNPA